MEHLTWAIRVRGEPARAARLLGAAEHLREKSGSLPAGSDRERVNGEIAALHRALGEERFTAARAAGRALTIDQAIAEALQAAAEPSGESSTLT